MAQNPLQIETYKIVADPTMDASAKQRAIDALWGAPPIAGPPGTDLRTADNAPIAPPPGVDNSFAQENGAVTATDAAGAQAQQSAMLNPTMPEKYTPAAPPPPPASIAAPPPEAGPTPTSAAEGAPAGMTADDKLNTAVASIAANAMRGTRGGVVAAHDQPVSSVEEKGAPIPDDVKEAVHDASIDEKLAAQEQGKAAEENALAAQKAASHEVVQARADETEQKLKDQYAADHLNTLDQHYEKMVKDTELQPNAWWTHRDTGHKILAIIAAGMFGLAGDPNGVTRMVEADTNALRLERDKKLGAARQSLEDFKGQMLSPEAAHNAEIGLGLRAAAAEAKRLAAAAAAPEARANALAQAAALEKQAALFEAQMAQHESGTVRTQIAHVPARAVGGPVDPLTVIKRAKEAGLNPEGVIRTMTGGNYDEGKPDDRKGMVVFPDHTVGYTSEDLHKETQNELDSLGKLQGDLNRMKALMTAGHSLAGADKERLKALYAHTTMQLSAMARGDGAQAKMAGEMLDRLGPLAGSGALETGTLDKTAKAGLDESLRIYDGEIQSIKGRLTPSPKTQPKGGKIETLGVSADEVGAKPSE